MGQKICGIYKIENTVNHMIYIGQSIDILKRWIEHKYELNKGIHVNKHLQRAWNKYGQDVFIFSIVELCNEQDLNDLEIKYIMHYKSNDDEYGYNLTIGGDGVRGWVPTDEWRQKLKVANAGENNPMFGRSHTVETKKKISEAKTGDKNAMYGKRGELSPNYRRKRTNEFKRRQSESHRGKQMSKETKLKQSIAKSGGNNPRSRAVYSIELDEYFWGAQDVHNKYNISHDGVTRCCKGKQETAGRHPITGEKLHWVYADELQVAV